MPTNCGSSAAQVRRRSVRCVHPNAGIDASLRIDVSLERKRMTPELWKLLIVLVFALMVIGFGMSFEVRRRQAAIEVIKKAIESGQALDPRLANALLGHREFDPRSLRFPGIMT